MPKSTPAGAGRLADAQPAVGVRAASASAGGSMITSKFGISLALLAFEMFVDVLELLCAHTLKLFLQLPDFHLYAEAMEALFDLQPSAMEVGTL
jgi:hypothetical protein